MPLPGFSANKDLREVHVAAHALGTRAAELADLAPPAPDEMSVLRLLASADAALSVLAERTRNAQREARHERDRLQHERVGWNRTRGKLAEALAELRERLRVTDLGPAHPDQTQAAAGSGSLVWALQHIDETLRIAGASEFQDEGPVDLARHRVVARQPSDRSHPSGTIAFSIRPGLLLDGEVLRPQEVSAYMDMD